MIFKFSLAFAATNYISLQNNFYLTCQGREFQDSVVAHVRITEPTLVTGRVKGRGEEVQPEDKGNKEDRGKVREPLAPTSNRPYGARCCPTHTHSEAVASKGPVCLAQEVHVVAGGESVWVLTGVGSFRHLSAWPQ